MYIVIIVTDGEDDFPLGLVVGVSVAVVVLIIATLTGATIVVVWYKKNEEKQEDGEDGEKRADKEDGDRKCSIFICCKGRETDGNVHDIIYNCCVYTCSELHNYKNVVHIYIPIFELYVCGFYI